ncbi:Hypp1983 [Branchiostoma lanceolatum]|uniref:Hypp1983 protein n=1 Tax=Branchiostoma lanceolatum TaxID=7740 RepID=A0A8J9ZMM2_BRALA|nr:Hypp1983 [Branchiostoma lanceolatum]
MSGRQQRRLEKVSWEQKVVHSSPFAQVILAEGSSKLAKKEAKITTETPSGTPFAITAKLTSRCPRPSVWDGPFCRYGTTAAVSLIMGRWAESSESDKSDGEY